MSTYSPATQARYYRKHKAKIKVKKHVAWKDRDKSLRQARRARGMCWDCNEPAKPGGKRCVRHSALSVAATTRYNQTEKGKARIERRKPISNAASRRARRRGGRFTYVVRCARAKGREWTLTREQYAELIALPCHYCTLPNDVEAGIGLDRLDNSLGYSIDNVVSACALCNIVRGNRLTHDEMLIVGQAIREVRQQRRRAEKLVEKARGRA